MPAHPQDIYDFAVSNEHATGDIWVNLSCLGLLGRDPISGLVITPACDLSNNKAETITFLPIMPIARYFTLPTFLANIVRTLNGQLDLLSLPRLETSKPLGLVPIEALELKLEEVERLSATSAKKVSAAKRVHAGLRLAMLPHAPAMMNYREILASYGVLAGSGASDTIRSLITNSYRTDIHFLPNDRQSRRFAGVSDHSIVLFRYPITIPVDILDAAVTATVDEWVNTCDGLSQRFPIASSFSKAIPQKRSRIRVGFMADLLTRYVSTYIRIGSPDFHERDVAVWSSELLTCDT